MSRLECKERGAGYGWVPIGIRICPDWNVKKMIDGWQPLNLKIRICPDWNVKCLKGIMHPCPLY